MLVVSDLMTEDIYALHATDTLRAARSLMSLARIRHIPVVTAEGRFLGLLTHRDLLAATASQLADLDEQAVEGFVALARGGRQVDVIGHRLVQQPVIICF